MAYQQNALQLCLMFKKTIFEMKVISILIASCAIQSGFLSLPTELRVWTMLERGLLKKTGNGKWMNLSFVFFFASQFFFHFLFQSSLNYLHTEKSVFVSRPLISTLFPPDNVSTFGYCVLPLLSALKKSFNSQQNSLRILDEEYRVYQGFKQATYDLRVGCYTQANIWCCPSCLLASKVVKSDPK